MDFESTTPLSPDGVFHFDFVPLPDCTRGALSICMCSGGCTVIVWKGARKASIACMSCLILISRVLHADIQPSSPGELHQTSGAALNSTSCMHVQFNQSGVPTEHILGDTNTSDRALAQVRPESAACRHRDRGIAWCRRLGMSSSAWDSWAGQHVNPYVAIGYFFSAAALTDAAAAYICTGIRGDDHMYYVVMVPLVCFIGAIICNHGIFWRWGPAAVHHKLYQPTQAFTSLCLLPLAYVGFLGSEASVPWHDQFYFLCIYSLFLFAMLQCASAGAVAGEHPAHPRTSIMEPFCRSALRALMLVDAISDLALSRSLVTAVCPQWSAANPFKKHLGCSNPLPFCVQQLPPTQHVSSNFAFF